MLFSPEDIRATDFDMSRRGFDEEQVSAFLEKVSEFVAMLQQEIHAADSRLEDLEARTRAAEAQADELRARAQTAESQLARVESRAADLRSRAEAAEARLRQLEERPEAAATVADAAGIDIAGSSPDTADAGTDPAAVAPRAQADHRDATTGSDTDDAYARLGSRVATVLEAADAKAAEITRDAMADAEQICREAEEYGRELRCSADAYDAEVRRAADDYARQLTGEALDRAGRWLESAAKEAESICERMGEAESTVMGPLRTAVTDAATLLEAYDASRRAHDGVAEMSAERLMDEVRDAAPVTATLARVAGVGRNGDRALTASAS